jgi:hypothetical protein
MKTIELKNTNPGDKDLTLLLSGGTLHIVGMNHRYKLNKTDATRLLMFCTDIIKSGRMDFAVLED